MYSTIGHLLKSNGIGLLVYEGEELTYSNQADINKLYLEDPDSKDLTVDFLEEGGKRLYLIQRDYSRPFKVFIQSTGNILFELDSEGNPIDIIIHSDDNDLLREAVSEAIQTGNIKSGLKLRLLKGKDWKWYSNSIGRVSDKLLGFGSDLSSIIAHSKKLRKLQSILEGLFKQAPIQIYIIDILGIVYIWEGKQWFLNDNILGGNYKEVFKDYPNIIEAIEVALKGSNKKWDLVYGGKHLESLVNPIYMDQEIIGAIGVITDNTELIAKAQELKQFAYIASHDLQEPVRMIHNYLQLLNHYFGEETHPKAKAYIDTILKSANKLKSLIEDLLSYSRVSARAKVGKISLKQVIEEVLGNLKISIEEKEAEVNYPLYTVYVLGDQTHILQLLQNLIHNALKFSERPIVKVSWAKDGGWVIIKVKDNGIGISQEHYEYIFQPFKRLDNKYPGTGMGLSICKKVVELNEGSISVESQLGKGTTFTIRLKEAVE